MLPIACRQTGPSADTEVGDDGSGDLVRGYDEVNPMSDRLPETVVSCDEAKGLESGRTGMRTTAPPRPVYARRASGDSDAGSKRSKGLNCLHCISGVLDQCNGSVSKLLQEIIELAPRAWQHADIACARAVYEGREYRTANFKPSRWNLTADINVRGKKAGFVEVHYLERRPIADEGPFLAEEKLLINAVGRCAGRAIDRLLTERQLQERIKELDCLYGISRLVDQCAGQVDELLHGIVELLPDSWQYPEAARARITLEGREYRSAGFKPSQWRQRTDITLGGKEVGTVEVHYLSRKPDADEGPFQKEERFLIDAVGERVGTAVEGIRAKQRLEVEHEASQNMNIALREVLARVRDEKSVLSNEIRANVDKVIMPLLDALQAEVRADQREHVALLRRNLEDITSPFADRLSRTFMSLTPAEIQVCDMVRRGLSTKEIAQLRHVSQATVSRHREHIRRKLGLTNQAVNLATYLRTFMSENTPSNELAVQSGATGPIGTNVPALSS